MIEGNSPQPPQSSCAVGNPIYPLTGAKKEFVRTGIVLGGIELTLTYDTTPKLRESTFSLTESASFGTLWRTNFHHKLRVMGSNLSALLSRGDGDVIHFAGGSGGFTGTGNVPHRLAVVTGGYLFSDVVSGSLEMFDTSGKLMTLTTAGGMTLTFSYDVDRLIKVAASDGRSVKFAYTNERITAITAPDQTKITASYDGLGNLSGLTWPDGKTLGFVYENANVPWAMTGKVDENGSRYATFTFDSYGRATSTQHAGGADSFSVTYGMPPELTAGLVYDSAKDVWIRSWQWQAPDQASIALPNGSSSLLGAQVTGGMPLLISRDQPAGSGCAAATSNQAYDSAGNVVSRDGFDGIRVCFAYDSSSRETVRVEGLANTVECSTVIPSGSSLPAGARKILTSWHPDWRKPVQVVEPGLITTNVYHGQSDPFNNNALANCTSAPALPSGKALPLLCKQVKQSSTQGVVDFPLLIDPELPSVRLLMHMDGAANSTTFVDSSSFGRTVTVSGTAKISATQSVFGGASVYFDGTASCLSSPAANDWSLGAGDFTVELWYNATTLKSSRLVTARMTKGGASGTWSFSIGPTSLSFTEVNTGEPGVSAAYSFSTGAWYHLAASRKSGTLRLFVNGVQVASGANTTNFSNTSYALNIGCSPSETYLNGHIDELRITRGVARYAGNFVPATQPWLSNSSAGLLPQTTRYTYDASGRVLSATDPNNRSTTFAYYTDSTYGGSQPGSYDTYFDSVALLLHGNGADGSTSFEDKSSAPKTVTPMGDAKITTAQSKFGGASASFDGNGDYLLMAPASGLNYGSGDFTVEGWFNLSSASSGYRMLFSQSWSAGTISIRFGDSGFGQRLQFGVNVGTLAGVYSSAHTQSSLAGGWHHVALTRSGGVIRAFLDGSLLTVRNNNYTGSAVTSWTDTSNISGTSAAYLSAPGADAWLGYVDDFRITAGVARYTANFAPATREFADHDMLLNPLDVGHMIGDLQSVTNAAGQATQHMLYDLAGRVRRMIDPKGVVTDITYTPRGRLSTVSVTPPGSAARTTTYTYDGVGQLTQVSQPDGTIVSYSYDAAHRLVGITDSRGNSISYTLDASGKRTGEEVRDRGGVLQRSISRSFDALNRLQQVTGASN